MGTYVLPIVLVIILGLFLSTTDQSGYIFNPYFWPLVVLGPLCFLFFILRALPILMQNTFFLGIFALFMIFLIVMMVMYDFASSYSYILGLILKYGMFALIVLVTLSLAFSMISSNFKEGWPKFWVQFVFYIPCLLVEFIVYISKELKVTPRPVLVLLVLEILLILGYFFGPQLLRGFSSITPKNSNTKTLQYSPVFLHSKQEAILANNDDLNKIHGVSGTVNGTDTGTDNTKNTTPRSIYTLSAWISINPEESIHLSKEVNIMYYASKELDTNNQWSVKYPKPRVAYSYDSVTKQDGYNIYVTNETEPYRLRIPNQRWNQFVFVFQDNRTDLFVNGHLVKSFTHSASITQKYTTNDRIVIGDDTSKLYGAVANVVYYNYAMANDEVVNLWNLGQTEAQNGFTNVNIQS
jgi:Concanavalin A-like lectin/glucanases superfamily